MSNGIFFASATNVWLGQKKNFFQHTQRNDFFSLLFGFICLFVFYPLFESKIGS